MLDHSSFRVREREKKNEGKLSILLCYSGAWGTCSSAIGKKSNNSNSSKHEPMDGWTDGMLRQWTKTIPIITIDRTIISSEKIFIFVCGQQMVSMMNATCLPHTQLSCTCFEARVILVDRFGGFFFSFFFYVKSIHIGRCVLMLIVWNRMFFFLSLCVFSKPCETWQRFN